MSTEESRTQLGVWAKMEAAHSMAQSKGSVLFIVRFVYSETVVKIGLVKNGREVPVFPAYAGKNLPNL